MIELSYGDRYRLSIDPKHGACLRQFDFRGTDGVWKAVLSPANTDDPSASGSAMFAMLPFANRARGNSLVIDGRRISLHPNTADPLSIHGFGWQRLWRIEDLGKVHCSLSLQPVASDIVQIAAKQTLRLEENGLEATLSVDNVGGLPAPIGLGWHPYFPHLPRTKLQFEADTFWLEGPDHLPVDSMPIPPELSFSSPCKVPTTWRNNCYEGWSGHARILQPDLGYNVEISTDTNLAHLMLYVPQERVFALEPQSHVSGRTSVADGGLKALRPGERMSVSIKFTLSEI